MVDRLRKEREWVNESSVVINGVARILVHDKTVTMDDLLQDKKEFAGSKILPEMLFDTWTVPPNDLFRYIAYDCMPLKIDVTPTGSDNPTLFAEIGLFPYKVEGMWFTSYGVRMYPENGIVSVSPLIQHSVAVNTFEDSPGKVNSEIANGTLHLEVFHRGLPEDAGKITPCSGYQKYVTLDHELLDEILG